MSANTTALSAAASAAATAAATALASCITAQAAIAAYELEVGHLSTTNAKDARTRLYTGLLSAQYWAGRLGLEAAVLATGAGVSQFIVNAGGIGSSSAFGAATASVGVPTGSGSTFFSETWAGATGTAWDTGKWNTIATSGGSNTVQSHFGQLVTAGAGADDQKVARHTAQADMLVSGSVVLPNATVDEQIAIYVRADGVVNSADSGYPNTGYGLVIAPSLGQIRFRKSVASVKSNAVSYNYAFDPAHLTVFYELLLVGTSLEVRVWNDNATRPSAPTYSQSDAAITAAGYIQLAVTGGAGSTVTTTFGPITGSAVVPSGGGGGGATPKAFANVWGAYTETNGTDLQSKHTTFETFIGHQSNTVVNMADTRQSAIISSMSITYAAAQGGGAQQWTPANKGSRRFVLFWPTSWAAEGATPEQDLLAAISDANHITAINTACDNYLIPVFGSGTGLTIRMPHEWELNYYAWGLTRSANNTPARMITQVNRQADAFLAKMPNVRFVACSIAGSVPFTGAVNPAYQIAAATRYQVLDGIYAHLGSKMMISADNYDTGTQTENFGDMRNLFDYAVAKGLLVGITETGIQTRGDNGQYPLDSWNNIKSYGQSIDHWCWFDSSQGGASRYLESNPNCRASILSLLATG